MAKLISINPTNNQELGEVSLSTEKEIIEKVQNANNAKDNWKEIGVKNRIIYLQKILNEIEKHKEELGDLVSDEIGMPKSVRNLIDIDAAIEYFKWYLENAEKYLSPEVTFEDDKTKHTVYYEPIGTAAVIVPWNFPVCNFVWGVIPNLVVGNTVVFKHSKECQLVGKKLEKIINNCGLPDGVFSEIYGDGSVGDILVHQDINVICFTGSTKIGKYLYKVAAEKFIKAVLELGGSAPAIVFEDADINTVLDAIYFNRFVNSGQICDGLKRLIVHESIYEKIVIELEKYLSKKKIGNPNEEKTDIGPLIAKRQVDLLNEQVNDAVIKGGKVIIANDVQDSLQGAFYPLTIITNVKYDMRIWKEEVFGPVLPIVMFKTETEAINLANDTKYGLGGYIFSKDKEKINRIVPKLKTGMIAVNSAVYLYPCNPFGGYKESGMGREHGKYGIRDLSQIKVVAIDK